MGDKPESERLTSPEAFRTYLVMKGRYTMIKDANAYNILRTQISGDMCERIIPLALEHGFNETFWMYREAYKLYAREYAAVKVPRNTPVDEELSTRLLSKWDHFVHLSKDEPLYIAYTPDANYGKQDRRVKTTVGRYLKKYYPELTDARIRILTDAFKYHFSLEDVHFAETAEEMIRVYTNGPHSCMGYTWELESATYGSQMHPVAAYAAPGIKLAYLMREGKINARCLTYTNPDNSDDMRWIRLYGDEVLVRKLESLGFRRDNLNGVKLAKIPAVTVDGRPLHDTFVMPYIDDITNDSRLYQGIDVKEDHMLVIDRRQAASGFIADRTTGLIGRNYDYVRRANDSYRIYNPETNTREESLADIRSRKVCSHCGATYNGAEHSEHLVHGRDNFAICPVCANSGAFRHAYIDAVGNRGWIPSADAIEINGDNLWLLNSEALIHAYDIALLDETYYGPRQYYYSVSIVETEGVRIRSKDRVLIHGPAYALARNVVRTTRRITLSTATIPPAEHMKTLFVDKTNGWLRTQNGSWPSVDEWLAELAAAYPPDMRRRQIDAILFDEPIAICNIVEKWIPEILHRENRTDLINEAAQQDLLCVEED